METYIEFTDGRLECQRCGAIVHNVGLHSEWHKRLNDLIKVSANGHVYELLGDEEIV